MLRFSPILIFIILVLIVVLIITIINAYKKCPPGFVLIITNPKPDSFGNYIRIVKTGGAFVWPFAGTYQLLSLAPISSSLKFTQLLSKNNLKFNLDVDVIYAISSSDTVLNQAVHRFAGQKLAQIKGVAESIISGQTRLLVAELSEQEIYEVKKLTEQLNKNISGELLEIGINLINLEIKRTEKTEAKPSDN